MNLNQHPTILAYNAHNAFGEVLNMHFDILEPGKVIYSVQITKELLATPLAAHGGVIASLMDGALGIAALSLVCEDGKVVSTIEFSTRFLKPVLLNDKLEAKSEIISRGKRILVSEAKIFNQKGELIAVGNGTFNAYPKEKAGL